MSFLIQQFNCQPQFPYGNPLDFFPLWVAAREDNTLSSRLTRPLHFPLYPLSLLSNMVIWPESYQDCQIKKTPFQVSFLWCIEYGSLSASRNFLMEILRISFLYGLRLAKTILCLRASPGLRFFHRSPLTFLMSIATWPGSYQDCQIKKTPFQVSLFIWQLPILPGRFQPSTFGVCELNFRVRHGNGCILTAIATISEGCSFKTI